MTEEMREYHRNYRKKNADRIRQYQRKYRQTHPEKVQQWRQNAAIKAYFQMLEQLGRSE